VRAHPALLAADAGVAAAEAQARLVAATPRDNPELGVFGRNEAGRLTEQGVSLGLRLRVPLATDARNIPRVAAAQADLTRAVAERALRRRLLDAEIDAARVALRLAEEAGVSAIGFHPRSAKVRHSGTPDLELARELGERLRVPMILSGGLRDAEAVRRGYGESGADAVMIARGALGYPWIFSELTGTRSRGPDAGEVVAELRWVLDRAEEHWGPERAARNLRKFYPWYLERLGVAGPAADAFQRTNSLGEVREMLAEPDLQAAATA
jgi:hypothetical protein